jgi:hypothetical protein
MAGGETWRKLHLAVNAASGMIVAQTLTDHDADNPFQVAPLRPHQQGSRRAEPGDVTERG